jgi:hypothetical protein
MQAVAMEEDRTDDKVHLWAKFELKSLVAHEIGELDCFYYANVANPLIEDAGQGTIKDIAMLRTPWVYLCASSFRRISS